METLDRIPVSRLVPRENVRSSYPKHTLKELAASIAAEGQLQPIGVKPVDGGKFEVQFGYRRYNAIKLISEDPKAYGLDRAPDVKVTFDEAEDLSAGDLVLRQVVENVQREDLSVMDEARAYAMLIEAGLNQSDISRRVGKNRSHVSKRLSLLELPAKVQRMVDDKAISIDLGVEMAKIKDPVADLGWVFDQLEDGVAPDVEEVAEAVKVALARQQAADGKADFAKALDEAGWAVLDTIGQAQFKLEKLELTDCIVTTGPEFPPSKVASLTEPDNALGIQVLSPTTARFLVATPKKEAKPDQVAVSSADETAARGGDTAALEKLAAADKAEKQNRRNALAAVRVERNHRLGFLSTVAAKAKPADVATLALQYLVVNEVTEQNIQRVCEVLGLDPEVEQQQMFSYVNGKRVPDGNPRNVKVWRKVFTAFWQESDKNLRQAAVATMISKGESALAERSPGFEISHFAPEWGYPQFLLPFDFQPVPADELLPAAPEEKAKPAKAVAGGNKAATKKAPAKKAAAPKKAAQQPLQLV